MISAVVIRFNQQLHEDSKAKGQTLAKKLASESHEEYMVQQIRDQMAQMKLVMSDGEGNVRVVSGQMPQGGTEWMRYGMNKAGQTV
ncbi:hypothetical protein BBJ41_25030 [Burkholderia stabilis]|uniref:hypothetical protein n=1 Tax=Burkholderia stabilis TaxID=95485 RepID=UPI0008519C7D|nr:hypothetical protein [Burkholderia stabilis]AOR70781.1 hypothetical protein BBJ41_25030 [Burkholderia stabilis]HDR9489738.1 hypothetical protein [Burkholderia stabilis]HDR9520832.1 hypothetical protein [Burkholderia stabilis]HDR9528583.1 hypothetical protein [Burkholderia stabilis]HDR9536580.1 hypothetical protein [Burkholderia stabilis]